MVRVRYLFLFSFGCIYSKTVMKKIRRMNGILTQADMQSTTFIKTGRFDESISVITSLDEYGNISDYIY